MSYSAEADRLFNVTIQVYESRVLGSDEKWLLQFGHAKCPFSQQAIDIYVELQEKYPNVKFGFVDILTREGELIKASYDVRSIPWTYFI